MATAHSEDLKRVLDDAFRAFEQGDDDRARRLCREALAIDPQSSTAHSLMGLIYEREGLAAEAADEYTRVIDRNPESHAERLTLERLRHRAGAGVLLGPPWLLYLCAGAFAAVVGLSVLFGIVKLVSHQPSGGTRIAGSADIEGDLALAREAFTRGDYTRALRAAERVLRSDPQNDAAREIYDRSVAYLQGAYGQPASPAVTAPYAMPQPTQPAAPATGTQPVPANQPQVQSTPALGAGGVTPAVPSTSGGNLPPPTTTNTSGYQPVMPNLSTAPGTPYTGGLQPIAPPSGRLPGYDTTGASRLNTVLPPRLTDRPSVDSHGTVNRSPEPIEPPNGADHEAPAPSPKEDPYIRIEVHPGQGRPPAGGAEVTPDTTPPADGQAEGPSPAERTREQQRRLREQRARHEAATRRAETLQSQD